LERRRVFVGTFGPSIHDSTPGTVQRGIGSSSLASTSRTMAMSCQVAMLDGEHWGKNR